MNISIIYLKFEFDGRESGDGQMELGLRSLLTSLPTIH